MRVKYRCESCKQSLELSDLPSCSIARADSQYGSSRLDGTGLHGEVFETYGMALSISVEQTRRIVLRRPEVEVEMCQRRIYSSCDGKRRKSMRELDFRS